MKCEKCGMYEAYGPNVGAALKVQNICSKCYKYNRVRDGRCKCNLCNDHPVMSRAMAGRHSE